MRVKRLAAVSVVMVLLAVPLLGAQPPNPITGRSVMERVDKRDDGDHAIQDLQMILFDKNGNQRTRSLRFFRRDMGEDTYSVIFFLAPADVKDTGFLTYDYADERDDDQWLYLPALKKVKRIAMGDKSGSFMGSDFTYADLASRNLDRYDYRLMKETQVGGVMVWQIEAIPNTSDEIDETGYTRSILFVRQDNDVVIRAVHWVKKGKRLKYFDVKKLELIDGVWVPTEMHMTTKKGEVTTHRTVLLTSNVLFNQNLAETRFSVRQLEKGP